MKLLLIPLIVMLSITCNKSADSTDCFSTEVSTINNNTCCGNLTSIMHMSSGKTVTVQLNDTVLNLSTTCSTFNIQEHPGDVHVKYYTYTYHPDSGYVEVCTDAFYPRHRLGQKTTWTAISGSITVVVSKSAKDRGWDEDYRASIRLDNVKFMSGTTDTTISLVLKDKIVYRYVP